MRQGKDAIVRRTPPRLTKFSPCAKHAGSTFEHVGSTDVGYVRWSLVHHNVSNKTAWRKWIAYLSARYYIKSVDGKKCLALVGDDSIVDIAGEVAA